MNGHQQDHLYYMPKAFRDVELGKFTRGLEDPHVVVRVGDLFCVLTADMMRAMITAAERSK